MNNLITVAIIGTAGRNKNFWNKMDKKLFEKMIDQSKFIIENIFKLDSNNIKLVSGGAAWSDHIVIKLYLNNYVTNGLIYVPAKWDSNKKKYCEQNNKMDPGRISNYYHSIFSTKINSNSLEDIDNAIKKGIIIDDKNLGFFNRNSEIAKSDYVIAFSLSKNSFPEDGGTADTWKKCKSKNKVHISLFDLF